MMTRQLTTAQPVKLGRTFSISDDRKTARKVVKCGQVIGVTAAECTAVCCCCPCGIVELLVLALYKLPTRLCKKALRWKKRRLMKKNPESLGPTKNHWTTREELEADMDRMLGKDKQCCGVDEDDCCKRAVDFENQMWDQFRGTGFWRSPSQVDR